MQHISTLYTFTAASVLTTLAGAQISFQPAVDHPLVGLRPQGVAVGDFDGVQGPDFAVTSTQAEGAPGPDRVEIFRNQGDGTFVAGQVILLGNEVHVAAITSADVDGDGDIDLAVTLETLGWMRVLFNNGGTFTLSGIASGGGSDTDSMTPGDLDGDGDADMVLVNRGSNTISVMRNNGTGFFAHASSSIVGLEPRQAALDDFNGDCRTDIAVVTHEGRRVDVILNLGAGTFSAPTSYAIPGNEKPSGLYAADLDADGDVDLLTAAASNSVGLVTVLSNLGSGTFSSANFPTDGVDPSALVVGDFDGDGDKDVVVGDAAAGSICAASNQGAMTFAQATTFATGFEPQALAVTDFDGNGSLDVVTANEASNSASVLLNSTVSGTEVFCATSPNTQGYGARIDSSGSLSLGTNTFTLLARCAPVSTTGLFFYGRSAVQVPFGDGLRCVGSPIYRLGPPIVVDTSGHVARPVDFTAPPVTVGTSTIAPASAVYFQFWYRNPTAGGAGFNTSDALEATFRP